MKLKISKSEAGLLDSDDAKTIKSRDLSGFRTAYLDYVGKHKYGENYLVSIDEHPRYLFDSKSEALEFYNTLK